MHMVAVTEAAVDLVSLAVTRSGTLPQRGGGFRAEPSRSTSATEPGATPRLARMFLDIWAPSSGCGFSATGTLKNTAVSRHAANFLAAATINLNMPPGSGGDSPMKGERRGGYARAF